MATNPKNGADPLAFWYGAGPHYVLATTIVGQGSGNAPIVASIQDPTNPPCTAEIVSIVRTATGVNTITLTDSYYAVAHWNAVIDDFNGASPFDAYLGQFTNLQTVNPLVFTMTTYTPTGSATDVALNTQIRLLIIFKKDFTGATA